MNADTLSTIKNKINEECKGYKFGTNDFKFKVESILNEFINDGVVSSFEWSTPIDVSITLVGDIKEMNITAEFKQ